MAARPSKRFVRAAGTAAAGAAPRFSACLPSPAQPMHGKPLTASAISPPNRTSWAISAITSRRTESRPPPSSWSAVSTGSVVGGHRVQQLGELAPGRLAAGREVLGRDLVRGRRVAPQDLARHGLAVDLVWPVVAPRGASEAVHRLER